MLKPLCLDEWIWRWQGLAPYTVNNLEGILESLLEIPHHAFGCGAESAIKQEGVTNFMLTNTWMKMGMRCMIAPQMKVDTGKE